ncbi:hypothetical protein [Tropicimonas aquimaris]|uniref:Uncharacterized protein n=1 Tax=Tropicimonas aquimaris TaxID=914152 RepID=A0ABW3IMG4_9RHOB
MSYRELFAEAEWSGVVQGPMLAGFAVTAADPNGLIGAVQESAAMANAFKAGSEAAAAGSLIAEVAAAYETSEGRSLALAGPRELAKGRKPAEACAAAIARLAETAASLRETAPAEAPAFCDWLRDIAANVAEATSEGGFLGFGGEKVSEAERKTLADIDTALAPPTG